VALATLSIDLVAQLAQLQQGMDRAGRIAQKTAADIESRYQRLSGLATSVGSALAGALSVAGLSTFFRATVDGLDSLNDLADATGATVESLSALEDVAARTGTTIDVAGAALLKLNKVLQEAQPGSPLEQSLKGIGLSAAELRREDPTQALQSVAKALSGYADDANKARLVQELFGKSVREVAPLLKDLAENGAGVATVTAAQAAEAEKFNKELAALSKNATDVGRSFVSALLPALNEVAVRIKAARGLNFGDFITGKGFFDAADGVRFYTQELSKLEAQQKNSRGLFGSAQDEVFAKQRERLTRLLDFYKDVSQQLAEPVAALDPAFQPRTGRPSVKGPGIELDPQGKDKASRPALDKPQQPAFAKIDDVTEKALKRLTETDAQKIAELRLELQSLIELRQAGGGGSIDEAILDIEEALQALSPAAKQASADKARLDAILAQTPTGQLQEVTAEVELLNRAFSDGRIGAEQWAEGVRVVVKRLGEDAVEPIQQLSEFAKQAQASIQDSLGSTLERLLAGNFASIGELWRQTLQRMIAQAAAAQLNEYLFGGGKSNNAGALTGFLAGLFGGARATGGGTAPGRVYSVNEYGGPGEMFRSGGKDYLLSRQSGRVEPVQNAGSGAGGGATYILNFNGNVGRGADGDVERALREFERGRQRNLALGLGG
jgi:hypothetical protein